MAAVWYPAASIVTGNNAGSFVAGYAKKGVLHTTEGSTAAGAISAYRNANSWPHFTINRDSNFTVYQHISIDKAARALRNLSGGVETNRGGTIQIEVVGFASEAGAWPAGQIEALRKLMRWIEAEGGVQPVGPGRPFANAFGQNNLRFSGIEWKTFGGWCGHCHVPENSHWDPGAIKIEILLPNVNQPIIVGNPMEVDVQLTPVQLNISLDDAGKGWVRVPYQVDKVVGLKPHSGTRPGADGSYDNVPNTVGITPEGDGSIIVVQGGDPGGTAPVWFHIIG